MPLTGTQRTAAAGAAAVIELAAIIALWIGLSAHSGEPDVPQILTAIELDHQPRPPKTPPPPPAKSRSGGDRNPPGAAGAMHSTAAARAPATPILPSLPAIPTSPRPQFGDAATGGVAQAGSGPGGAADGSGSGSGAGDGGGDGREGASWIGGRINDRDYPRSANAIGAHGTTIAEIDVSAAGRVKACRVARSSGNADLDAATCRLVTRRFRFSPARDSAGRAVSDTVGYEQEWTLGRLPNEPSE